LGGVYRRGTGGTPEFLEAPAPTDEACLHHCGARTQSVEVHPVSGRRDDSRTARIPSRGRRKCGHVRPVACALRSNRLNAAPMCSKSLQTGVANASGTTLTTYPGQALFIGS